MKQVMSRFGNWLLERANQAAADIACLHAMGMAPAEMDTWLGLFYSGQEDAYYGAEMARLKQDSDGGL